MSENDNQKYTPAQLGDVSSELPLVPGDLVTLPHGSSQVTDADEEVYQNKPSALSGYI